MGQLNTAGGKESKTKAPLFSVTKKNLMGDNIPQTKSVCLISERFSDVD